MRIPSSLPPPSTVRQTPRNDAARAAQRAFFDAARGVAPTQDARGPAVIREVAPVRPVQATQAAQPAPRVQPAQDTASTDAPRRLPRPGSIIDIKV